MYSTTPLVRVEHNFTAPMPSNLILSDAQSSPDLLANDVPLLGFVMILFARLSTQFNRIALFWSPQCPRHWLVDEHAPTQWQWSVVYTFVICRNSSALVEA